MKSKFEAIDDVDAYPTLTRLAELSRSGLPIEDVLVGCRVVYSGGWGAPGGLDLLLLVELASVCSSNPAGAIFIAEYAASLTTPASRAVLLDACGYFYTLIPDPERAKACFHEAINLIDNLEPDHASQPWAREKISTSANWLAWYKYLEGAAEKGLPWAKRAVEANPENFPAIATLGSLLYAVGERDEAMKFLDLAMAQGVDPEPGEALREDVTYIALAKKHGVGA